MGDPIEKLQINDLENTSEETSILEMISPKVDAGNIKEGFDDGGQSNIMTVVKNNGMRKEITNVFILSLVYVVLSSDIFWGTIVKISPKLDKWYYKIVITTVLFASVTFILTNMKFIQK